MPLKPHHSSRRRCMSNNLPLSGMLDTISSVEYTRNTRDECIVELSFEEAIAVCVDKRNTEFRGDGDVVVADANYGGVFCVCGVNGGVFLSFAGVVG
jgi:hypothetical protein